MSASVAAILEGGYDQPAILVRAGQDPVNPHHGTLSIGEWEVRCVVGRNGLVPANRKREGDGCTPIGRFALRYGFYDPAALGDAAGAFDFPFKPKPSNYYWSEDPDSPVYNRFVLLRDADPGKLRDNRLFDLFVPIGWNDATPLSHAGSAIFLHAARPEFTGTAGCVAVAHDVLLDLARRLRPGMMIDIQPAAAPIPADAGKVASPPAMLEIVTFQGLAPGPRVLITGAVHGNEPCGPKAIGRAIADFREGRREILRGSVTFVPVVNGLAFRMNAREGERNLNRNLAEVPIPGSFEDRVANVLCPLLRRHDVLIDLHSFRNGRSPFVLVGPEDNAGKLEPFAKAREELALARALGLDIVVHGWVQAHARMLEARDGGGAVANAQRLHSIGTTEYMRFAGGYGVTVECGRHDEAGSVETAYRTIFKGLAHLGVTGDRSAPDGPTRLLEMRDGLVARAAGDSLVRAFDTGEAFHAGEIIGHRADGEAILAPYDGAMIFAATSVEPGGVLCYLCTPSQRQRSACL